MLCCCPLGASCHKVCSLARRSCQRDASRAAPRHQPLMAAAAYRYLKPAGVLANVRSPYWPEALCPAPSKLLGPYQAALFGLMPAGVRQGGCGVRARRALRGGCDCAAERLHLPRQALRLQLVLNCTAGAELHSWYWKALSHTAGSGEDTNHSWRHWAVDKAGAGEGVDCSCCLEV
jgi:hypothetical protein